MIRQQVLDEIEHIRNMLTDMEKFANKEGKRGVRRNAQHIEFTSSVIADRMKKEGFAPFDAELHRQQLKELHIHCCAS